MDYFDILQIQGIDRSSIKNYYPLSENYQIIIFVELFANQKVCPYCQSHFVVVKERRRKCIKALPLANKETIIEVNLPRYLCKACGKTFTHQLNTAPYNRVLQPMIDEIIEDCHSMITFSDIARKYYMNIRTVLDIFDQNCPNKRAPLGEAICIDEFSNIRNSFNKYACMMVDFKSHKIIDIIKSRKLPYLRQYFRKQPICLRKKVLFLITDMYDGYITIAKEFFPNATIAIDPYHYMTYFTNAVQDIRRRLFDSDELYFDRAWMGKHWRFLTMNEDDLPTDKMVLSSGESISYSDRVRRFVSQNKELSYAYYLLQDFYFVSKKLTYDNAIGYIDHTIRNMINSDSKELISCGNTWSNYKEYITNSFIKYNGTRLSNGPIEGVNSRVKTLKKLYCGYRNEERFYNRIILIINESKNSKKG